MASDAILLQKSALSGEGGVILAQGGHAWTQQDPEQTIFKDCSRLGRQAVDSPCSTANGKVIKLTEIGLGGQSRVQALPYIKHEFVSRELRQVVSSHHFPAWMGQPASSIEAEQRPHLFKKHIFRKGRRLLLQ